jgi:hypothetical protein
MQRKVIFASLRYLFRGKFAKNTEEASKLMQGLAIEDGLETIQAAIAKTKRTYNAKISKSQRLDAGSY